MASDLHMSSTDYSTAVSPAFPPLARKRASVSGSPRDFFFADAPLLASVYSCRFSSSDTCSTRFPPTWFSRAPSLRSSCLRSCSSGVSRSSLHLWSSRESRADLFHFLPSPLLLLRQVPSPSPPSESSPPVASSRFVSSWDSSRLDLCVLSPSSRGLCFLVLVLTTHACCYFAFFSSLE